MDVTKIQLYDEKKEAITRILDAAVKTMDFEQKNYLTTKAQLMRIVEKPGYESLGLPEVVAISNKLLSKVATHSGYVVPDKGKKAVVFGRIKAFFSPAGLTLADTDRQGEIKKQGLKGQKNLLQLIRLLPPYISSTDVELYSAKIRSAPLGVATSSKVARTTGDFDQLIAEQVLEAYAVEFDALIKDEPDAFMEAIVMASGAERMVDIRVKLRKQLSAVASVGEFLSMKDLVDRHLRDYRQPEKTNNKNKMFFWRKK
ncbi:MAG: hypothetical protein RPT25_05650 [Cycloclasticus sp.]